jgi:hypothetical protein
MSLYHGFRSLIGTETLQNYGSKIFLIRFVKMYKQQRSELQFCDIFLFTIHSPTCFDQ